MSRALTAISGSCRAGLLAVCLALLLAVSTAAITFPFKTRNPMSRTLLNPDELIEISALKAGGLAPARPGYNLKNRIIAEVDLAGIQLHGARMENVEFDTITMVNGNVTSSVFVQVDFGASTLDGTVFKDAEFISCTFVGTQAEGAQFTGCVFRDCRTEEFNLGKSDLRDCTWKNCTAASVVFDEAKLLRNRFESCELDGCTFYNTGLGETVFRDSSVAEAVFSGIIGKDIAFENGSVRETGFDSATFAGLRFTGVKVFRITFQEFKLLSSSFTGCPALEKLTFLYSELKDVSISGCKEIVNLEMVESTLANFVLADTKVFLWGLGGCTVGGDSRFQKLDVYQVDWSDARIDSLSISACNFDGPFYLNNAVIKGLKLNRVSYGREFELFSTNTVYEDSDQIGQR